MELLNESPTEAIAEPTSAGAARASGAHACSIASEDDYVFAGNARRWKYVRVGLFGSGAAVLAAVVLLVGMCVSTPDLPDLALDTARPRAHIARTVSPKRTREADRPSQGAPGTQLRPASLERVRTRGRHGRVLPGRRVAEARLPLRSL